MTAFGDVLLRLSVVIQRRYTQICAEHDLTPTQALLLCQVKEKPSRMAELATSLGMSKNALSQLVDRTEQRGLVHRHPSEQDRRVITLDVTPTGRRMADALYADVTTRIQDIAAPLSPKDQFLLELLTTKIIGNTRPDLHPQ
ncbi:MAG TPA: MarR family transcriptional regulator [Actinoplanes sp.]|nr:MarR family transcriptional regulator [Actinoplanes sp.]